MSTYYLMDMHVPVIANSRIVDVVMTSSPTDEVRVDGLTPVKIPDGVRVINPTSLTDILLQKYAGILAMYPGFSRILYDDLLDATGLEPADPGLSLQKLGSRSSIAGNVKTLLSDPSLDVSPTIITRCIVVYETYTWKYVDPQDGRIERWYVEQSEAAHAVRVSVNAGSSLQEATSGALVEFAPIEQGSGVQIQFDTHFVENRLLHTGSWALIY